MASLRDLVMAPGAAEISWTDPAFPDRPLMLYAACPAGFTAETPVLFSHHGRSRNGRDYRDYFLPGVDTHNLLVIAPEFSLAAFPGQPWYNAGNMRDADGHANPPAACTYAVVAHLFAALQSQGVTARQSYGVFGHSAGSQYVHRMVSFGHATRVAAAVAANAGTYTWPDFDIDFPYGLGGVGLRPAALAMLLSFPLTIMAGTADNNPAEPFFPNDPDSMRQGPTRYQRAQHYFRAGQQAAQARGIAFGWRIIDVPGVAHDGRAMAEAAAPLLAAALHGAGMPA
jgi:hypothetical protein